MLLPGRGGHAVPGGWATLGSSNAVPASLAISSRVSNDPSVYTASEQIEFTQGFESGSGDSFEAYLSDGSNNGGGGGGNNGLDGTLAQNSYRYGFNGKEKDNEVKGEGNEQNYGMRIYDPRLGRFLSVDPLTQAYPWYSPYQFAGNSPLANIDLDGLEPSSIITNNGRLTEPMIQLMSSAYNYDETMLRKHRFYWTNSKVTLDQTTVAGTKRGGTTIINRFWQDSYIGDSYEMFWLNTTGHEMTHARQYAKNKLLTDDQEPFLEAEAKNRGDLLEAYVRVKNNGNLFDKRWSEGDRAGYARYLGLGYKIFALNQMLSDGQAKEKALGKKISEEKDLKTKDALSQQLNKISSGINSIKNQIEATQNERAEVAKKYDKIINISYL